jgi:ribonuclease PH
MPIRKFVAAVSVGICRGEPLIDLNYEEDKEASVDMNLVMTDDGQFVELQGAGEETTFSAEHLAAMLEVGRGGIAELLVAQQAVLASANAS